MQPSDSEQFSLYRKNRAVDLRNQLVESNKGLVRKVAHRVAMQCREPYEDLEQVGNLGLIRAIERFDPTKGTAFSSFAVPFIRGEMLHYLRDKSRTVTVPRAWQECYQSVMRKQRMHVASTGKVLPEKEAIAQSGISSQDWLIQKQAMSSWVLPLNPEVGDSLSVEDEEDDTERLADYVRVQEAVLKLPIGQRQCIEAVYFEQKERRRAARDLDISLITLDLKLKAAIITLTSILNGEGSLPCMDADIAAEAL